MLRQRLTLLQAVSLNMAMMVGIGPFMMIPALVGHMQGSHALIIWVIAAVVAIADGLVWSELAAAFPGSGGTYHFYDAVYGESLVGRLLKFLFVWQFLFSAPLELASGAIGCARYAAYLAGPSRLFDPGPITSLDLGSLGIWTFGRGNLWAMLVMAAVVVMAYRKIEAAGRMMVTLWVGMLATVLWITVAGFFRFDAARAFAVGEPWRPDAVHLKNSGIAMGVAMYMYLGYYQVCYLADEVDTPSRTIPRSILISVVAVSLMYFAMNLSLLGAIPWEVLAKSEHVASDFMGQFHGRWAASLVTVLIMWTATAGTFAALLSYGRVPYAAARAGHFFSGLAATHPRGAFPHRSLLLVGALAIVACLAELETVISALLTSRILIQFVGQIATIVYIRTQPELRAKMAFRMWFYPMPAVVALAGWLYVFGASKPAIIGYGVGSMVLGGLAFLVWDRGKRGNPAMEESWDGS